MINWSESMKQTFEYYEVDPNTWLDKRLLTSITSCSINRTNASYTLGNSSIDYTEPLGECYIRVYIVCSQNGGSERYPLGTVLIQTPSTQYDGTIKTYTADAYTPLIELKEKYPPYGYTVLKDTPILERVSDLAAENMRARIIKKKTDTTAKNHFTAETDDTWLSYLWSLVRQDKHRFDIDEMGTVMLAPIISADAMSPVYTFNDDNSSILYPDIHDKMDLYGTPNVVEVVYSTASGHTNVRVVNDDPKSILSTVSRGREIVYRKIDPDVPGTMDEEQAILYAKELLKELSTLEHTVTFKHGFIPNVRVGDCVMLNYKKADVIGVKAIITDQTINCESGCYVSTTATYTTTYWE